MTDRIVKITFRGEGITTLSGQVTALGKSVAESANRMTAASKESAKFRQGLSTIGSSAGKVGLVAAAGLGLAIGAAARFDAAMSRVQAASHESAANMELLRVAAIKAGQDTVFSATESADAITAMSKAGVSAKDILSGGLTGALSLASAGELDVASAADIAATAMNQFGLQGKDIPHIADLLAAAAGKAQGEVTDMANSLKFVGPVAHQMGVSIEETTGTIAELASQGILGEQAGTGLRGMLTALTSPSALARREMSRLGISLYDANGQFVGLRGVAGQLSSTMGKLSNAERDQALGRIFGNEQITAARILYAGGAEAVDKWTKAVNDQGYAADTAAIKMNNLKGDLEQLRGSVETALIGLGEGDQGALRSMTQHVTSAVNAFNTLPGPVKSSTTALLALTAVTGGGLWFGSKVVGGIAQTRIALKSLGIEATTTRAALAGIGKGIEFAVIIEGLGLVDAGLRKITNSDVNTSTLAQDLQDLGDTGQVTGTLLKTFGGDLEHFGKQAKATTQTVPKLTDKLFGFLPGSTAVATATKNFGELDAALASMVQSGDADTAARAYADLSAGAEKYGVSAEQLANLFPTYTSELTKGSGAALLMSDAMTGLIPATDGVTAATGPLGQAVQQATADLQAQNKAYEETVKRAKETADSFFGLGQSVNDSKVSLNDWIADLEKQADALRNFTTNVRTAAKRGLKDGLIAELEAAGPAGAMRLQQLANASDKEISRANRAWARGQRAIDAYVNTVAGVPPGVGTTLTVSGDQAALARLRQIKNEIDQIPRRFQTDYYVIQHNAVVKPKVLPGAAGQADGGTVQGPRYPYGDKVLTFLAPGEEVISNRHGQADRFRADRATGRIPAYADGGTIGGLSTYSRSGGGETPRQELKRFKRALEESTKAIQTETSKRDDLVQARDSLVSTVSGHFTSDIFASKLTGGTHLTQDPLNALRKDIADAQQFQGLLGTLSAKGLSGQAFQSLAETGDVRRAQAFAALSPGEIAQFQSLFDQRANASASVGGFAGDTVYKAGIDTSNQHLAALNAKATQLEHEIKVLQQVVEKSGKGGKIVVNDKSGNPKHTAKEVSRRQKWAGKR